MNNYIYFVGGASASGKTTITKKLSAKYLHPVVELDKFHMAITPAIFERDPLVEATRNIAIEVIRQLLSSNASCIVEGAWINPEQAKELRDHSEGRFHPVYCGYPEAAMDERFQAIKISGTHWLAMQPEDEARAFLIKEIVESKWYMEECQKHQIPFFDFSDFETGNEALAENYAGWFEELRKKSPLIPALMKYPRNNLILGAVDKLCLQLPAALRASILDSKR